MTVPPLPQTYRRRYKDRKLVFLFWYSPTDVGAFFNIFFVWFPKKNMYLNTTPDPDLLIRTGGFQRLSNFILLNISYTEIFFTKTLWPDLSKIELLKIFNKFYKIERKYGL